MHNPNRGTVFVGIDVSARELAVAQQAGDQPEPVRTFANTAAGHQQLCRYLGRDQQPVRVCVEASGNYSLDLCLALHAADGIELSVINPRLARRFAESPWEHAARPTPSMLVCCVCTHSECRLHRGSRPARPVCICAASPVQSRHSPLC